MLFAFRSKANKVLQGCWFALSLSDVRNLTDTTTVEKFDRVRVKVPDSPEMF